MMLHGFMGSSGVFQHFIEDIKSFCNPILIDLAGHGKTESTSDPARYTAQRQAEQLVSIIQRLNFQHLYLYGYSMGGRLAFQLLASNPELFSGAIIESSHCGLSSEKERIARIKLDENRAELIESNFDNFIEDWNQLPLFEHTPPELKSQYKEIMMNQKPDNMAASLRGFGAGRMPNVCTEVKKLSIPLALVAGEFDSKYVSSMDQINDQFESSDLHIVEKAGHRVHADRPDQLILILKKLLT